MIYDIQRADFWKRISAFIFDKILLFIVAVGVAFLLSFAVSFDKYDAIYTERQEYFSEQYSTNLYMTEEEYEKVSAEDQARFDEAIVAFSKDEQALYALTMMFNLTLIITVFSTLIAYMSLEFFVPLAFGNGQTLGKKVFGIAVMRMDGVKLSPMFLLVRTLLGKYTVETMVPLLILIGIGFSLVDITGVIIMAIIAITNIAMVIATKTNSPIHDMLANTVAVDMSSQLIFDTPEEVLAYKQRIHAEMVDKADY